MPSASTLWNHRNNSRVLQVQIVQHIVILLQPLTVIRLIGVQHFIEQARITRPGRPDVIPYLCASRHVDVAAVGEEIMIRRVLSPIVAVSIIPLLLVVRLAVPVVLVAVVGAVRGPRRRLAVLQMADIGKADLKMPRPAA